MPGEPPHDIVIKLLSRDPNNYRDAPTEGIRRILEKATGRTIPRSEKISTEEIGMYSFSPYMQNTFVCRPQWQPMPYLSEMVSDMP